MTDQQEIIAVEDADTVDSVANTAIDSENGTEVISEPLEEEALTTEEVDATDNEKSRDDREEVTRLSSEIEKLRALLDEKQREQEKILSELGDFSRLFPDISVKDVPKEVWKRVENGIPLSASYALYERERQIDRMHAEKINGINASLSAGMAGKNTPSEYYSPDEVRQMSPKEVHENYSKIKNSMKFWR